MKKLNRVSLLTFVKEHSYSEVLRSFELHTYFQALHARKQVL